MSDISKPLFEPLEVKKLRRILRSLVNQLDETKDLDQQKKLMKFISDITASIKVLNSGF